MISSEDRLVWDKSPKEIQILEGNNSNFIARTCFNSPFFFVSERDAIDKRINFKYDRSIYSMSTFVDNVILTIIFLVLP